MTRRFPVSLAVTLAIFLILVAALVAGALFVRSILSQSFAQGEEVRAARILVADALRAQIDEETGVRGYTIVRDPILLEPYDRGRADLPVLLRRIRLAAEALTLREAIPLVDDARDVNRRWLRQVVYPLLVTKKRRHVLELRGKVLIDRFRADVAAIDRSLGRREMVGDARAQRGIAWMDSFALFAVVAVAGAAAFFTVQQYRLGLRLERGRAEAEEQRRQSAAMRAAYEAEKRIADTLQEAFAQRMLPTLPAIQLSGTYVPATEEAKVGGDWYDGLQLPDDRVLLVIGDVAGHGIDAAVAMNKARQMVISCALIDPTPGDVLERVNAELFAQNSTMITAIVGLVDARSCEFAYAAAGHPAPVLLEPGRRARFLDFGSLPLAVNANASYATYRVSSVPGAILVLYTDGVIEHSRDVVRGETLLLEAVESVGQSSGDDPATAIREKIFAHHHVSDDVAILTIHFLDSTTAAHATGAHALGRTA